VKSTGIVRQVDNLGRVVLPVELRRVYDISEKDSLEIYVDDEQIILKKYAPSCIFCNNAKDTITFKGKIVCNECAKQLRED
jgi:transcriptional pleiotropic regulator of transition state genes